MEGLSVGAFFFNHPTLLFLSVVTSVVAIIVLFVWNIILTMLVKKQIAKGKLRTEPILEERSVLLCPRCGSQKVKFSEHKGNDGYKKINACDSCGFSWEVE